MSASAKRKNASRTIKYLSEAELKKVFQRNQKSKSKRDRAIFLIAYRHGLRPSEVGLIQVGDVDFDKMRTHIERLKGSYSGENSMQPDEVRILKSYLKARNSESPYVFLSKRGLPISRQMLDVLMRKYGELANLPQDKRHFHVLKHSIATHLIDAGADVKFVKDWLGHANINNTEIYAKLLGASREKELESIF